MNDRELLELAAKAAGYASHGFAEMACGSPCLFLREADFTGMWAPLTDDGDALRLAIKLRMAIDTDYNGGAVAGNASISCDHDQPEYGYQEGMGKPDPYSATRRAIVSAAAEIGKAMK